MFQLHILVLVPVSKIVTVSKVVGYAGSYVHHVLGLTLDKVSSIFLYTQLMPNILLSSTNEYAQLFNNFKRRIYIVAFWNSVYNYTKRNIV